MLIQNEVRRKKRAARWHVPPGLVVLCRAAPRHAVPRWGLATEPGCCISALFSLSARTPGATKDTRSLNYTTKTPPLFMTVSPRSGRRPFACFLKGYFPRALAPRSRDLQREAFCHREGENNTPLCTFLPRLFRRGHMEHINGKVPRGNLKV